MTVAAHATILRHQSLQGAAGGMRQGGRDLW
jgi:hypothetical protein